MAASSSQIQELSISEDKTARLKAVFLEAMRGNTVSYVYYPCMVELINVH